MKNANINKSSRQLTIKKRILIMRHNKFFSAAIALCAIAFFTVGSAPSASALTRTPVTITGTYDFSTFPDVTGTFVTTGALTISGDTTMHIGPNYNGTIAHCVVTLIASDGSGRGGSRAPLLVPCVLRRQRWRVKYGDSATTRSRAPGKRDWPLVGAGP